jgi:hypothetical protein
MGEMMPCLIYSSSFEGAKIVVNTKSGLIQKLQEARQAAALKFCFNVPESDNTIIVMVNARSKGSAPYGGSKDMILVYLQYLQRPPDDLIVTMGRILDANANAVQRRGELIAISPDTQRKLHILSPNVEILIQGVPRQCILRDISFSGAKVVIMGLAKFLEEREVALTIDFEDPASSFSLKGRFVRSEIVEGRRELLAMVIAFDEALIPIGYKIRINNYISQIRGDRGPEQEL